MAPMLADENVWKYDIIAIQEPWRNKFQAATYHPVKDRFDLVYNTKEGARVCLFINCSLRGTWSYTHHTPDLDTLHLKILDEEHERTIHIHNIYNPINQATGESLSTLPNLRRALEANRSEEHIVLGDFNLHHPMWAGTQARRTSDKAGDLLELIADHHLELLLPIGTKTRQERGEPSTIDLVFGTRLLSECVLSCGLAGSDLDHDSDHLPITTLLSVTTKTPTGRKRRVWHQLREKDLIEEARRNLRGDGTLGCTRDIEEQVNRIVQVIGTAITNNCPESRVCPRSVPGWTPEIKEAQMQARRLRRRYQELRTEQTWEEYREARNLKGRLIKKLLRKNHRERVQKATESPQGLWKLAKWAKNKEQRQPYTPPLKDSQGKMRTELEDKVEILKNSFFPQIKEADLSDIQDYVYPSPVEWPPFTQREVRTALSIVATRKAPGQDGIPNLVLNILKDILTLILTSLFNACITYGYCPNHFKVAETVSLRKPGKEDYTEAKSYRPVALLSTLGKILEKIIARRLSELVERFSLLPATHMGGRKGVSTDHALHWLLEKINVEQKGKAERRVVSILSLDVSGAFDNVSHPRLLHNLRKRRIDPLLVQWVASFLKDRQTTIRLPEGTSELMDVETGIPQGSPLSPILYLFFNADLIEACHSEEHSTAAAGWIDDANIITWGSSTEDNCRNLESIYTKCKDWEVTHASKFNPDKYSLIHLPSKYKRVNLNCSVRLEVREVKPVTKCRILGLILDNKLSWDGHIEHIEAKTTKSLGALSSLAGSTWGTSYKGLRQIYQGMILPQITYGASAWYAPVDPNGNYRDKAVRKLEAIQRRAAKVITGAFKTVSGPALDVEAFLLPLRQHLNKITAETYLRIYTTPLYQNLTRIGREGTWRGFHDDWHSLHGRWGPLERHRHRIETVLGQGAVANLELRKPFLTPVWWEPPEICILDNAESARARHDQILAKDTGLVIYTDGSAVNGKVGAAAIQYCTSAKRQMFLGRTPEANVFLAELLAIDMALKLAQSQARKDITIFSDSQAAIRAIGGSQMSGQQILNGIFDSWAELRRQEARVAVYWIPAHQGIPGNELADQAAKEATGWRLIQNARRRNIQVDTDATAPRLVGLKQPLSTFRGRLKAHAYEKWELSWQRETRGRTLFRTAEKPLKEIIKIHAKLARPLSSILTQMRTGNIGLRHFLYRRGVPEVEDGECQCQQGEQTVQHVMLSCSRFRAARNTLWTDGTWTTDLRQILSKERYAARAARFMLETKLLGQFWSIDWDN